MNNGQESRYQLLNELGQGGFGAVYRALDRQTSGHVAIKFLQRLDPDSRARFQREVRILQELAQLSFVPALLDWNLETEQPWLAIEYCEGGSLCSWVGAGKPWTHAALAVLGAAKALAEVHGRNGHHRDVKPANLLVGLARDGETWVVKLADFGLGGIPTPSKPWVTQDAFGTEAYKAPEIRRPGAVFNPKADVWSLGVTTLEVLTGGRNLARLDVLRMPKSLRRLVRAMLAADPAHRPNARRVAQVAHAILSKHAPAALTDKTILAPKSKINWGAIAGLAFLGIALASGSK